MMIYFNVLYVQFSDTQLLRCTGLQNLSLKWGHCWWTSVYLHQR